MTKDELLQELLVERYGPGRLPEPAPPHQVEQALAVPEVPPPAWRRRRHLAAVPPPATGEGSAA